MYWTTLGYLFISCFVKNIFFQIQNLHIRFSHYYQPNKIKQSLHFNALHFRYMETNLPFKSFIAMSMLGYFSNVMMFCLFYLMCALHRLGGGGNLDFQSFIFKHNYFLFISDFKHFTKNRKKSIYSKKHFFKSLKTIYISKKETFFIFIKS